MNSGAITKESLLFSFPRALQWDPAALMLGNVTAEALADRTEEIDRPRIVPNIDEMDEALLDILARDFKVDWWDPNYSVEEKRQTLKDNWRVHKKLGTKAAVERAIRAIYPKTTVEPWFKYEGGQPYHFRVNIDITGESGDMARQKRVLERLEYYKSLRDTLDEVKYFIAPEKAWALAGGGFAGSRSEIHVAIKAPPLRKPGGAARTAIGMTVLGSRQRIRVAVRIPPVGRKTKEGTVNGPLE